MLLYDGVIEQWPVIETYVFDGDDRLTYGGVQIDDGGEDALRFFRTALESAVGPATRDGIRLTWHTDRYLISLVDREGTVTLVAGDPTNTDTASGAERHLQDF